MAVQLQLVFDKASEKKNKLALLKNSIKQEIEDYPPYVIVQEEIKKLQEKRKGIIENVLSDKKKTVEEIDVLKCDLESDKIMISDLAIANYLKGKKVEVKDAAGNILVPIFSVKFVKK